MEHSIGLIVIGALLEVVLSHLKRRDIAVVDLKFAVLFFIEDVTVIEDGLHLHLSLISKHIGTVVGNGVLVDWDITILCQLEDVGEKVHLLALRLHGVVKTSILVLRQVDLTVDITSPHNIFWHLDSRGEGYLCTDRHGRRGIFRLCLLLLFCFRLDTALLGLRLRGTSHQCYQYQEQNTFHIFI